MVTMLADNDQARVTAAIAAAAQRTAGEIICVLSGRAHRPGAWAVGLAALGAFVLPWLLTLAGWGPGRLAGPGASEIRIVETYAAVQALLFLVALLALWWSPLSGRLAPRRLRRQAVHDMAVRQFLVQGAQRTRGRTGVLLFVSAPDRIAEIVADTAIYAKVPADAWGEVVADIAGAARAGALADGLVAAVGRIGDILAAHFPPEPGGTNQLSDHLVILR
jgi:putative membrane protein